VPLIDRIDGLLGGGVEAVVEVHHRRRLERAGQADTLRAEDRSEGWSRHGAPPRPGNRLEIHVDGKRALAAMVEAIRGARHRVDVAGWHLQPDFLVQRESGRLTVRELLAEAAERVEVRVLLWAGAPLPVYHPNRRQVREAREALVRGTRIRCALDRRERPLHCHHEKLVAIDGERAFVGGIDLTAFAGDRFDAAGHPPRGRLGWHDAASEVRGPAAADVARHLAARWLEVTGEDGGDAGTADEAGTTEVQVVRTVPDGIYRFAPRGEFGILDAYLGALSSARSLIYLENQFLWSPEITDALAERLRHAPDPAFRVVLVLPAKPKHRGGRHARAAGVGVRGRRGEGTAPRVHDRLRRAAAAKRRLRPRQGRCGGRPVADRRLGQPERAFALQRHRGERRLARPRPRP
jgi:phosphatidylserine/phosphatidylglycerophosphate/cardiolipin synthase-like enzyme